MSGEECDGGLSATEAFSLVGHEVRAEILRALGDARDERGPPAVLPFSELHSRAAIDVGTSRFNYHLGRLDGEFVERVDDGWRLRQAGTTMYRTIRARSHGERPSARSHRAGFDCHHCESPVTATYDDWGYALECPGCEYVYDWTLVPPGVAEGPSEGLWGRLDEYVRHRRRAFVRGVCPICANALATALIDPEAAAYPRPDLRSVVVNRYCDHCTNLRYLTVGEVTRHRQVVTEFFRDRGIPIAETPLWEFKSVVTDETTTVDARDPWEVTVRFECEGDALTMTVDGDLAVVDSTVR